MRKKSKPERRVRRSLPSGLGISISPLRVLSGAALAAALSACAVAIPVDVTTTQGALPNRSNVSLAPFPSDSSLRGQFGAALTAALTSDGIALSEEAPVIADFAVAERSAAGGTADPEASTTEDIVWSSQPREPHWWDQCEAKRLQGTLILLNRADGTMLYRGVAEAIDCDFGAGHFEAMARALVSDAQAN